METIVPAAEIAATTFFTLDILPLLTGISGPGVLAAMIFGIAVKKASVG